MDLLLKYFPELTQDQLVKFSKLQELYKDWNLKINVVSRKDIDELYLRHVLHSLGIAKVVQFKPNTKIMDVGTGGGFPGIPLAILFPETHFHLVDSIGKKIKVVESISNDLSLKNVRTVNDRVENHFDKYVLNGNSILRPIHYPPITKEPDNAVRAAAHGDINLITLLMGASASGLEVQNKKGEWIAVTALPEQLVVNVGDMLERLTNNKLRSTIHRQLKKPGSLPFTAPMTEPYQISLRLRKGRGW